MTLNADICALRTPERPQGIPAGRNRDDCRENSTDNQGRPEGHFKEAVQNFGFRSSLARGGTLQCLLRVRFGSQPRPRKRLLSGAKRKSISGGWRSVHSQERTFELWLIAIIVPPCLAPRYREREPSTHERQTAQRSMFDLREEPGASMAYEAVMTAAPAARCHIAKRATAPRCRYPVVLSTCTARFCGRRAFPPVSVGCPWRFGP